MEVTSLNIQWFPQQRGNDISISKLGMWPRALILATKVWDEELRDLDTPALVHCGSLKEALGGLFMFCSLMIQESDGRSIPRNILPMVLSAPQRLSSKGADEATGKTVPGFPPGDSEPSQ